MTFFNPNSMLERPVYQALTETQRIYSVHELGLIGYNPSHLRLIYLNNDIDIRNLSIEYGKELDYFYVVSIYKPNLPKNLEFVTVFPCYQMVVNNLSEVTYNDKLVLLDESHKEKAYDLIWKVMPGFYEMDTFDLGIYYGIIEDDKLVSVTGVRMECDDYQELSAVVTDQHYRRRGYSRQLSHRVSQTILDRGKTPFLHVLVNNDHAIAMYENLGYEITGRINFYKVRHRAID